MMEMHVSRFKINCPPLIDRHSVSLSKIIALLVGLVVDVRRRAAVLQFVKIVNLKSMEN